MVELIPNFDKVKNVINTFGMLSMTSFKKNLIKNILKGVMKKKLEDVRPDQLYTHITNANSYSNLLEDEGKALPDNTMNILRNLNRFVDIKKELNKVEPMIDNNCGLIMLEVLRSERPDLYQVIVNTPGGSKMIWMDARNVWENIKKEIRNAKL